MSESINKQLMLLKGFTFNGDTGRTISDLYETIDTMGYTGTPHSSARRGLRVMKDLWD